MQAAVSSPELSGKILSSFSGPLNEMDNAEDCVRDEQMDCGSADFGSADFISDDVAKSEERRRVDFESETARAKANAR